MKNWYRAMFEKYFVFEGRDTRAQHFQFTLLSSLFFFVAVFFVSFWVAIFRADQLFVAAAQFLMLIATIPPTAGSLVRRLHDANLSGWWALMAPLPLLNLFLLLLIVRDSDKGDNKYGPATKYAAAAPMVAVPAE